MMGMAGPLGELMKFKFSIGSLLTIFFVKVNPEEEVSPA